MRTSIGNRWREVTKNHSIIVDCEYHRRYCPPRWAGTSPRRMKRRRNGFSPAACRNTAHYVCKQYNEQEDDDAGQNNRWYLGHDRRPYRSAFRQPMPLSDADDNGASLSTRSARRRRRGCDRSVNHSDGGRHCVVMR